MIETSKNHSYRERLHDLYQLEFFGMKLGLDNIRALLYELGDPQEKLASIHIAGTNGKGSVASMLSAVHQAAGKKVGLFTSPHLVDFRERIRIDGRMIDEESVARFLERIWPKVQERNATFFEVTTALAFDYFAAQRVDIAIIETGLGGRLDATNVLSRPLATVITSIGFDHMQYLGNTLGEIANEKAGILKSGVPAIVNCPLEAEHVFAERAKLVQAPLTLIREYDVAAEFSALRPSLQGAHQELNLRTVLATLQELPELPERPSLAAILDGISRTTELSGLRGRLEDITPPDLEMRGVRLVIDVAHNAPAFEELARYYFEKGIRPIVVLGLMKDKSVGCILEIVKGFATSIVAVEASTARAMSSESLVMEARAVGLDALNAGNVAEGYRSAMRRGERGDEILICGSHYVIGEFLQNFHGTRAVV